MQLVQLSIDTFPEPVLA